MTVLGFFMGFFALLTTGIFFAVRIGVIGGVGNKVFKHAAPSWINNIAGRLWISFGTVALLHIGIFVFYPTWFTDLWNKWSVIPLAAQVTWTVVPFAAPLLFFNKRPRVFLITALVFGSSYGGSIASQKEKALERATRVAQEIAVQKEKREILIGTPFTVIAPVGSYGESIRIPPNTFVTYENLSNVFLTMNNGLGVEIKPYRYGALEPSVQQVQFRSEGNVPAEVRILIYGRPSFRYGIFNVIAPPDKWSEIVWIPEDEIFKFDSHSNPIFFLNLATGEEVELLPGSQKPLGRRSGAQAVQFKSSVPGKSVEITVQIGKVENDDWRNSNKKSQEPYVRRNSNPQLRLGGPNGARVYSHPPGW